MRQIAPFSRLFGDGNIVCHICQDQYFQKKLNGLKDFRLFLNICSRMQYINWNPLKFEYSLDFLQLFYQKKSYMMTEHLMLLNI